MTFEDSLTGLERWARIKEIDQQLAGQYVDADFLRMIRELVELTRTSRALITKLEETLKFQQAEIARLETLAFFK